jgi:hypothetical protein
VSCWVSGQGNSCKCVSCIAGTQPTDSFPRQILKILPPDVADAVKGVRGAPNIWQIPQSLHRTILSGLSEGSYYNAVWRMAIQPLLDKGNITPQEVFAIQDQLVNAFSIWIWEP